MKGAVVDEFERETLVRLVECHDGAAHTDRWAGLAEGGVVGDQARRWYWQGYIDAYCDQNAISADEVEALTVRTWVDG